MCCGPQKHVFEIQLGMRAVADFFRCRDRLGAHGAYGKSRGAAELLERMGEEVPAPSDVGLPDTGAAAGASPSTGGGGGGDFTAALKVLEEKMDAKVDATEAKMKAEMEAKMATEKAVSEANMEGKMRAEMEANMATEKAAMQAQIDTLQARLSAMRCTDEPLIEEMGGAYPCLRLRTRSTVGLHSHPRAHALAQASSSCLGCSAPRFSDPSACC